MFRGAGWNVIKVIWGGDWDDLFARDKSGLLLKRMEECVDGDYQKYVVEPGSYTRKHFFGKYPELLELVNHLTDDQIRKLLRGGHDARKVYAAYKSAVEHKGQPTVILAKTVKGYGLGEAGEGKNISHQQKKMNEKELREFRERFKIPISDDVIAETPFYRPAPDSVETKYLLERRQALGGFVPARNVTPVALDVPKLDCFADFFKGSNSEISTTTAFGNVLRILLRQKGISRNIVPIIPDEARTFGLDAFFREIGIYSSKGQLYEPVDSNSLLYYHEAKDGQILEEGITEAGSMASFIVAGTSYATHGVPMIPFYIYYSMFGPQRVGDLFWLAGDIRAKGFLLGATSGRTTLNGEGLQHQDGHSLLHASTIPTCLPYDPAFGYELAVIITDGLRRMYVENEDIFYYLSLYNENYPMPPMPAGVEDGILKGLYKFKAGPAIPEKGRADLPVGQEARQRVPTVKAHILGSGPIIQSALKAQEILANATAFPPMSGARPATNSCALTPSAASAGTCCTRPSRRRIPISKTCWRKSRGHSWPCRTTSAPCPTRLRRGFRAACSRWARTALAAATPARGSGASLKWTPNPPSSPRFTRWREKTSSAVKSSLKPSRTSALIRKKTSRRLFEQVTEVQRFVAFERLLEPRQFLGVHVFAAHQQQAAHAFDGLFHRSGGFAPQRPAQRRTGHPSALSASCLFVGHRSARPPLRRDADREVPVLLTTQLVPFCSPRDSKKESAGKENLLKDPQPSGLHANLAEPLRQSNPAGG